MEDVTRMRAKFWHLQAFLDACNRAPFTQDERERLAFQHSVTEEHISAAYAAADEMRLLEATMAQHLIIREGPSDKTVEWTLDEEGGRLYVLYGRWFRSFLNEARSALESLMFKVVFALRLPIVDERQVDFYGQRTSTLVAAALHSDRLHSYLVHITAPEGKDAPIATIGSPRARFHDLNSARRISFHRRPYNLPVLPMFGSINDEPLRVSSTHILLQDDLMGRSQPTFRRRRSVRTFVLLTMGSVVGIADDVYRLTARVLDLTHNPVLYAQLNRKNRRANRGHRYTPPLSMLTYIKDRREEAIMREALARLTGIFSHYDAEAATK